MKKKGLTRRDLIKCFGALAFVLTPVARAMGYVAGGTFTGAPRFVMFFKGARSTRLRSGRLRSPISARLLRWCRWCRTRRT